jgi:hypothetical protein
LPLPTKQPAKLSDVTTNAITTANFFIAALPKCREIMPVAPPSRKAVGTGDRGIPPFPIDLPLWWCISRK